VEDKNLESAFSKKEHKKMKRSSYKFSITDVLMMISTMRKSSVHKPSAAEKLQRNKLQMAVFQIPDKVRKNAVEQCRHYGQSSIWYHPQCAI